MGAALACTGVYNVYKPRRTRRNTVGQRHVGTLLPAMGYGARQVKDLTKRTA